jgi:hypothetical protein
MKRRLNKTQREWIAKLKSGKTKKATEQLADGEGRFCCLGVGARVCGVPTKKMKGLADLEEFPEVMAKLGLRSDSGHIDSSKIVESIEGFSKTTNVYGYRLASLNDNGWTHVEIGNFIDANRDAVFREPKKKAKKS